jgi:SOS-response transcriptional repressor LexA
MIKQLIREDKTGQVSDFIKDCGFELESKGRDSLSGIIPIVNKVSAGYPAEFDDMSYPVGVADDYINCPGLNDPNAFAVRVVGDSMSPEYMAGDIVVFSPAKAVNSGDDCFVRFKNPFEATFKRVYFERDSVRLQPRNTAYSPMVFDSERIDGIYKAVLKYQYI